MTATSGFLPHIGDLVWLSPTAGAPFREPFWFRVIGVRTARHVPGWCYLTGRQLTDDGHDPERTIFCRVAGLVVRTDEDPRLSERRHGGMMP